jgi:transcription elongation factor GreA
MFAPAVTSGTLAMRSKNDYNVPCIKKGAVCMHDELTREDIQQMQAELTQRRTVEFPKLIDAVKEARAFGDLSENFEYKAAKQELNRCKRRIRYLENMIKSAVVIEDKSGSSEIGLYDKVTVRMEGTEQTMVFQIVTAMRADALKGLITRESPVGQAIAGHCAGDVVTVHVRSDFSYNLEILSIEKQEDDGSIPISTY